MNSLKGGSVKHACALSDQGELWASSQRGKAPYVQLPSKPGESSDLELLAINSAGTVALAAWRTLHVVDGNLAAYTHQAYLIRLGKGAEVRSLPLSSFARCAEFHPQQEVIAVGEDNGNVSLFSAPGGHLLWRDKQREDGPCMCVSFDRSGGRLAVGHQSGEAVKVYSVAMESGKAGDVSDRVRRKFGWTSKQGRLTRSK